VVNDSPDRTTQRRRREGWAAKHALGPAETARPPRTAGHRRSTPMTGVTPGQGLTRVFLDVHAPSRAPDFVHRVHTNSSTTEGMITPMNDVHGVFRREGLIRPLEGRVLGGVFAGLGRRFGLDPWPARLLFTVILLAIPGSQILLYPVFWILMPSEKRTEPVSPYIPASMAKTP
jgi:phage shock protein C